MVSETVRKLLKSNKLKLKEYNTFKEEHYGNFPVDETTVAQHFCQSKGIKLEFPEYRIRGIPRKIRQLTLGEFPSITVAIGPEMTEPIQYVGCKVDGCYSKLDEGNCTKREGGHGYQGEKGAPTYTTRHYKVSDGPHPKRDSIIAICRHDVNDGEPISGVWKLKGLLNDNGDFYCWAGIPVSKEELDDWDEDEEQDVTVVAPDEDDVPDLSHLEEEKESESEEEEEEDTLKIAEEKGITPEEAEGGIPPEIVKKFKAIMANEHKLSKEKIMVWLKGKEWGTEEAFNDMIAITDCEIIGKDVIAPWAQEEKD